MARVTDPPDLVRVLARIRRPLRRLPASSRDPALDHLDLFVKTWARAWARVRDASRTNSAEVGTSLAQAAPEPTTTPEDTLRAAGIADARQATYQRKFSTLLAGKEPTP
jgi:hypothetical protein